MPPHLYLHTPMTTKLIPPSLPKIEWKLKNMESRAYFPSIQFGDDESNYLVVNRAPIEPDEDGESYTTEASVRVYAKLLYAAPAMAEALILALDALESLAEMYNMTTGGVADQCRAALLSAGYTLAADPE